MLSLMQLYEMKDWSKNLKKTSQEKSENVDKRKWCDPVNV